MAGRSQNSLITGLARHGADLFRHADGICAAAGALLAAGSRGTRGAGLVALHADETAGGCSPREPGGRRGGGCGSSSAGHRLLRMDPPLRHGDGPPRRDRRQQANSSNTPKVSAAPVVTGRGAAAAGHLQRLLQRLRLGGARPAAW